MSPSLPATAPQIPGVDLIEIVGRGGSGVVYRGRQEHLDRDVAVKVLASTAAWGDAEAQWRREVSALGRLSNHPNIVAVYSGGVTDNGSPYLVMPFVPGGTLEDRLLADGPMTPTEVAEMGAKLAGSLATAHEAGVLHRDVKPANVLVSPYGEPQLADFGIAKMLDATTTLPNTIHATVTYAAPEVLDGRGASEASDIYGLGATLFTCLASQPPFGRRDDEPLAALISRIVSEAPAPLEGVPLALVEVIDRALAKDPADRHTGASGLRDALESAGEVIKNSGSPGGPVAETEAVAATVGVPAATPTEPPPETGSATSATSVFALDADDPFEQRTDAIPVPAGRTAVPEEAESGRTVPEPARGRARWWILALLSIGVLGVAAALVMLGNDDNSDDDGDVEIAPVEVDAPEVSSEPEPTTTDTTETTEATNEAPATSAAPQEPASPDAGDGPTDAAITYIGLLADGDFDAAWQLTSKDFQASQNRGSWQSFWAGFDDISIVGEPSDDGSAVVVPLSFDGKRENYRLTLSETDGGSWRIDGPVGN